MNFVEVKNVEDIKPGDKIKSFDCLWDACVHKSTENIKEDVEVFEVRLGKKVTTLLYYCRHDFDGEVESHVHYKQLKNGTPVSLAGNHNICADRRSL